MTSQVTGHGQINVVRQKKVELVTAKKTGRKC